MTLFFAGWKLSPGIEVFAFLWHPKHILFPLTVDEAGTFFENCVNRRLPCILWLSERKLECGRCVLPANSESCEKASTADQGAVVNDHLRPGRGRA